ncbi:MAG: hypothetical protein JWQ98_748 [Chlorobi bacterium]|nr:hypothetical protein [Chlorobiota bacterium]
MRLISSDPAGGGKNLLPLTIALIIAIIALVPGVLRAQGGTSSDAPPSGETVERALSSLPVVFRRNAGQWEDPILYQGRSAGANVYFMRDGLSFGYTREIEGEDEEGEGDEGSHGDESDASEFLVWNLTFAGMNPNARVVSEGEHEGNTNYLRGEDFSRHLTHVPEYSRLWYRDIYPHIDLRYYGTGAALKYDYIVAPEGNIADIRMACSGIEKLAINAKGQLEITNAWGTVAEEVPFTYQVINGARREVASRYRMVNDTTFGFAITGGYDHAEPIVIDPIMLAWSTFVGGTGDEQMGYIRDIAVDKKGNVYGTGWYTAGFPTTPGVYGKGAFGPDYNFFHDYYNDVFVFKLDATGTKLIYSTYIGGSSNELGLRLRVNDAGEAFVTGQTFTSGGGFGRNNFPITANALSKTYGGNFDLFALRLSADGTKLIYSTYIGGDDYEDVGGIAIDQQGSLYICGSTSSSNFPTTAGAIRRTPYGNSDIFVSKLADDGSRMIFSTYIGQKGNDSAYDMALDRQGNIYVSGWTSSTNFPVTAGAYATRYGGAGAGVVLKLAPDGGRIIYATFIQSANDDKNVIAVDRDGSAVVAGTTNDRNFPTTAKAYSRTLKGASDAFVVKLDSLGATARYSTLLGGSGNEQPEGIALAAGGEVFISGRLIFPNAPSTRNFKADFPVTRCALEPDYRSQMDFSLLWDGFVSRLSADGARLEYSTYLGGKNNDYYARVIFDTVGGRQDLYISITTHSPDFVTTPGSFQPVKLNTARDQPVVMKLSPIYRPAFTHRADNCGGDRFFDSTIADCIWTDSTWTPGSWRWDFGDGSTSTDRNPIHSYTRPGDYAVTLVTGAPYDSITTVVHIAPAGSIAPAAAAHIATDNRAMPGDSVTIPVVLDTPADTLGCRRIAFSILYDSNMMSLANATPTRLPSMLKGTLVEGWTPMVTADRPGFFSLTLDAPLSIQPLKGKGNILELRFSTFIKGAGDAQTDSIWRSPLPFDLTLYTAQCAPVATVPGELRFELCGMRERLIIATMSKYALRPNAPNPVHSATDIEFSLGLDGYTTLAVYNARGEKVETLVDGYLEPGSYAAHWDGTRHPSGVYHYRLSSGTWSAEGRMLLTK